MSTIPNPPAAVNPDTLALEAVCQLRADWLVDRPIVIIDDRHHESPLEELYDPCELRDDEAPGLYPTYQPSPADEAWAIDHPGFQTTLARACDLFRDSDNASLRWLGDEIGKLYDLARHLEAISGEQFDDRRAALAGPSR